MLGIQQKKEHNKHIKEQQMLQMVVLILLVVLLMGLGQSVKLLEEYPKYTKVLLEIRCLPM
jgi:hypothetical protein